MDSRVILTLLKLQILIDGVVGIANNVIFPFGTQRELLWGDKTRYCVSPWIFYNFNYW